MTLLLFWLVQMWQCPALWILYFANQLDLSEYDLFHALFFQHISWIVMNNFHHLMALCVTRKIPSYLYIIWWCIYITCWPHDDAYSVIFIYLYYVMMLFPSLVALTMKDSVICSNDDDKFRQAFFLLLAIYLIIFVCVFTFIVNINLYIIYKLLIVYTYCIENVAIFSTAYGNYIYVALSIANVNYMKTWHCRTWILLSVVLCFSYIYSFLLHAFALLQMFHNKLTDVWLWV